MIVQSTYKISYNYTRDVVRSTLSKFFSAFITDFNLFVDTSKTALPRDLNTCYFVAGLKILVKDLITSENIKIDYDLMDIKTGRSGRSSLLSLTNKRQDSLDFIEETEEENSQDIEVSSRLNEMVPAASEIYHGYKKNSIPSPKCRRLSSLQHKLSGFKEDKIIDCEDLKSMLDVKLGFLFKTVPNLNDCDDTPCISNDWTHFIDENILHELNDTERSKQDAIWELLCTEVSFIRKIHILLNIFVRPVRSIFLLHDFLNDNVQTQKIFSNIEDVYEANSQFWKLYLKPMYERLANHGHLLDVFDLKRAFAEFTLLFFPYVKYITDQNVSTEYFKETYKRNTIFRYLIDNCERRSSERLSYLDLFIQPMQRLTRYKLLLQAIMKRCTCDRESCELSKMIEIVEDFVKATNSALVSKEEKTRIEDAMQRIAIYDSYLAPAELHGIIKEQYKLNCWIDLTANLPNQQTQRQIIHHGLMKMKDYKEKLEVYCYLLTDMFVILRWKKNSNRLKLYRGPIKIDKIDVMQSNDEFKANFTMIIRGDFDFVDSGYSFYTQKCNEWIKMIENTRRAYLYSSSVASGQTMLNPAYSTLSKSAPRVLYSFQPNSFAKVRRRCTTNSCKTCGIKSKEAEDSLVIDRSLDSGHPDDQSTASSFSEIYSQLGRNDSEQLIRTQSRLSTMENDHRQQRLEDTQRSSIIGRERKISPSYRICSIDDLEYSMFKRYNSSDEKRLICKKGEAGRRAIFLSYLQREDSLMSTGSKKSSSGISSSNSSSLLNILEDVI
ncbi:hypothetical protein GJ496_011847 [Pomphorhynchus laevis]|nr:hypothetical protein GJ496_011847 [Pomphorhynchus laevis]